MTFSKEWEQLYRNNAHMSIWPWSDLVSYVNRYAKPSDGYNRTLELGCGAGANIPFFLDIGADYMAVEGSSTIVEMLHQKYPQLKNCIVVADFTEAIPFITIFDLIVDRGSLVNNSTDAIRRGLKIAVSKLRSGGKFIGIDWFSNAHSSAGDGIEVDSHSRRDIITGHLAGTGIVHFSDQQHLIRLLTGAGLIIERLEHKLHEVMLPHREERLAWWNFVAVKP